ncbi:MAG TPA: 7-cyano-7-deazaguanine synthase QueC [Candidatus Polarisedimenticolaceae bacterium]
MHEAIVLLSGGLDSATTLAIARAEGFRVHALTVAYGQRHSIEVERARELAAALGAASHRVIRLDLRFLRGSALTDPQVPVPKDRDGETIGRGIPSTYVPARNTVFLSLALAWAETIGAGDIYLGVNSLDYSGYPDCRPEYLAAFESMARLATRAGVEGNRLTIHAPLLHATKAEIVRRAVQLGVDLGRTISCYDPGARGRPCGACDACVLRARGFADAGLEDPALLEGGD